MTDTKTSTAKRNCDGQPSLAPATCYTAPSAEELAQMDAEANHFAMCLLMPEDWVRREVKRMGGNIDIGDDKAMKKLADKFKVSVTVMTLRLGQISRNVSAV
jgi:Zn-dependent peptidase ImmA (M78 family)